MDSAGARFGFNPNGAASHIYQAEAFADWQLPWAWELGRSWGLQSQLEGSVGWLGESRVNAALATVGPNLVAGREKSPVSFDAGISLTGLTRYNFPTKDFGMPLQFTSHAGLNFDISGRVRLSYRFEHMSNGSLSRHNPGLNLHTFGLSYLF